MFYKQTNSSVQKRRSGSTRSDSILIAVVVLGTLILAPLSASAEGFADVYAGGAFTSKGDIDDKSSLGVTLTLKDVEFDSSATFGGRGGYWFNGIPWYGVGLDIFYYQPNIDLQVVASNFGPMLIAPLDVSVLGIGFDVLQLRTQMLKSTSYPNGQLQPYLTAGPVLAISWVEDSTNFLPSGQKETDRTVGVKVGGGVKWFIHKNVGLFAEYRLTYAKPKVKFDDVTFPPSQEKVKVDITTQHLIAGASLAF